MRYKVPLFSTQSYDVVLLQELWMRPDHETIRSHLPAGYWMSSEVREVTAGHWLFSLQRLETWLPQTSVTAEWLLPSAPASPSSPTFPSGRILLSSLFCQGSIVWSSSNLGHRPRNQNIDLFSILKLMLCSETSPSPLSPSTAVSGIMTESSGLGKVSGGSDWSQRSTLLWRFSSALFALKIPTLTTDKSRPQSSERLSETLMQILY